VWFYYPFSLTFEIQKCFEGLIYSMEILQEIKRLSHLDKLRVMEALWKDLSEDEEKYDSPEWHEDVLKETENRVNDGAEEIVDWDIAKKNLRKQFE
jgi:hypothetical protein